MRLLLLAVLLLASPASARTAAADTLGAVPADSSGAPPGEGAITGAAPGALPHLSWNLADAGVDAADPTDIDVAWVPALGAATPDGLAAFDLAVAADSVVSPLDTLRMSPWERLWWGRRGIIRRVGLFPTHPEESLDDLRQIAHVRRRMLGIHQTAGLVTVASMAATVVGGQLAVSGHGSGFHEATLPITIGLYTGTAALSLLAPPKPITLDRESRGPDSITIHRWLAIGHVAGMILTPLLAPHDIDDATVHQITGYATFATFSAAMLVVTLLRR